MEVRATGMLIFNLTPPLKLITSITTCLTDTYKFSFYSYLYPYCLIFCHASVSQGVLRKHAWKHHIAETLSCRRDAETPQSAELYFLRSNWGRGIILRNGYLRNNFAQDQKFNYM